MTAMPVHEFRAGDGDGPFRGVPFRFIVAIGLGSTGPQHGRKRNPAEWVEAIAHLATGLGLFRQFRPNADGRVDRKSTRLNSSHPSISYAVFCLKKKKKNK